MTDRLRWGIASRSVLLAAMAPVIFMGGTAACRSCTEIGCLSQLTVIPNPTVDFEVCVDDACMMIVAATDPTAIALDDFTGDSLEVHVRNDDIDRPTTVRTERFRPNGDGCDPECAIATLDLSDR